MKSKPKSPLRLRLDRAVNRDFESSANIDLGYYSGKIILRILDRELNREEKKNRGDLALGLMVARRILKELKNVLEE